MTGNQGISPTGDCPDGGKCQQKCPPGECRREQIRKDMGR